ncbi:MAG: UDP-N-acetylmuramate dehydrogenase [Spirochaetales bacterium]|nr:UDP-N-acetylmuramate dehydrogenase [Spirochaetales bacterium]
MVNLREMIKKINIEGLVLFDEPMKNHTSFCIGGCADVFVTPHSIASLIRVIRFCRETKIPYFLLGRGANILVADAGIRGMVINTSGISTMRREGERIVSDSGAEVSTVAEEALKAGLTGCEFFYSMPGSVGGAVRMNARCYGVSTGDVVSSVEILGEDTAAVAVPLAPADFSYKKSPFQNKHDIILSATFTLKKGDKKKIKEKMDYYKEDREKKGHFLLPSAGSIFKNNQEFGRTTGLIIDSLKLKGYSIGDAQVSPLHGNIFVNRGNATAADVLQLIILVENKVKQAFGFNLEREIILAGEWQDTE